MSEQKIIPVLHHLTHSQSHRVLFALEELAATNGTKFKLDLLGRSRSGPDPPITHIFPLNKSPVLTVEDEDGKRSTTVYQHPSYPGVLTESVLILRFLSEQFGAGAWDPQDETDRRQDVFFQTFANDTLAAKATLALVFEVIAEVLPWGLSHVVGLMVRPVVNHWRADLAPIYALMEQTLSAERPWFAGRAIGLADFNVSWGMDLSVQRGYFEHGKYPKLADWYARITGRAAYKRALERGGTYNLKTFAIGKAPEPKSS